MTTPSWTSGYVSDVSYTLGFYREMAPPFLHYASVLNGFSGIRPGPVSYCELGCGRGYGTALLAAANPDCAFVGIDFNPAHIREARALAERAGLRNVAFVEASFADAARSADPRLESFDVVTLHGVYSWVGREVREDIHAFLRDRLAPGGVVYVSYNTYPGWAASAPVQRLLREYAERTSGDSMRRLAAGRAALKALAGSTGGFLAQNPPAKRRIELMDRQNPSYVVHEFLDEKWSPLYVTEAIAALSEAKLTYAGSASIAENRPAFAVPADLADLVRSAPDVALRELLKDFAVDKQFRRDIYVKGPTRLTGRDAERRSDELTLALVARPAGDRTDWPVPAGMAKLKPETVAALLAAFAAGPATLGDARAAAASGGAPEAEIAPAIEILVHHGVLSPCRPDFASVDPEPARRLNQAVFDLAAADDTHQFLAAPVLGSAVGTSYFDRLAGPLLAGSGGAGEAEAAASVLDLFEKAGKRLVRDGKALETPEEASAHVAAMVRGFRDASLPRWRALGIWS